MRSYPKRYHAPIIAAGEDGGCHFLDGACDPRLQVTSLTAAAPDLAVVRGWRADKLRQAAADLPPPLLERIVAGDCTLVLDASGEGPAFEIAAAVAIHKMLREAGISASKVAYLTQNRAWATAYRGFCYAMQVEPVHVIDYDYYIRNFFVAHETSGSEEFAARQRKFQDRAPIRDKSFVCLNFTPRPAKVLLLLKLLAGGQFDQGFVSFPGFDKSASEVAAKRSAMMIEMLGLPGLEEDVVALLPYIDDLGRRGNALFGAVTAGQAIAGRYNALSTDTPLEEYNRSWFTVVTESEVFGRRRITEKPFKPLANFSPYINFGNPGSLALVRSFGFETFGAAIDEAYDEEGDLRRRFHMVYAEIARLCALTPEAWRGMEAALAEGLTFNAHHALVTMPALYRDVLEPQLVDRLMDIRHGVAAV